MDFPTVVSAAALVNNALSALKSAKELAKDSTDTDLKEKIGSAYDTILDLKAISHEQDDKIRQLEQRLSERAAYAGPVAPHGYFYAAEDAEAKRNPLCPTCFQNQPSRIGFLGDAHGWNGGLRRTCKLCGVSVYEQPMNSGVRVTRAMVSRASGWQ